MTNGIRATVGTELAFDAIQVSQDATSVAESFVTTPGARMELRWPHMRHAASGATHVLEPVAMIGWTGGSNPAIANDQSTRVEFDEGNLLSLMRFPAPDRREHGPQAAVGVNWTRFDPKGWHTALSLGQVWRASSEPDFTQTSGLSGTLSDVLVAGQVKFPLGLALSARGLFGLGPQVHKAEARASWAGNRLDLDATYVWLGADAAENRTSTISEWNFDASYRLGRHWTAMTDWRYDISQDRTQYAGIGLEYRNECVKFDFFGLAQLCDFD